MDNIVQDNVPQEEALYKDVCGIIEGVRRRVATYMNAEVCMTNWYIGKRIKEDVLYNQRADYGKQIVKNLAVKLQKKYGNGWGEKKLRRKSKLILLEESSPSLAKAQKREKFLFLITRLIILRNILMK